MAHQQVTGPASLQLASGATSVQAQYIAAKVPATWTVQVVSDGALSPGDYTVTISSNGLLKITLAPGVVVASPGTSFSLQVSASAGPGAGNNASLAVTVKVDPTVVPCFVAGTRIARPSGAATPVDQLAAGDAVATADGGIATIRWIGSQIIESDQLLRSPSLRPVRLPKNALGPGLPDRDLLVSPLHRIRLDGWRAQVLIGQEAVLVHTGHLPQSRRLGGEECIGGVRYFHILCDDHQVILAEGLPAETLFLGDVAEASFGKAAMAGMLESSAILRERGPGASFPIAHTCARQFETALLV